MTNLIFRKQIETVLDGLIGEYTLSPGVLTPAIRFREGEEQLDENIAVSGLEVVFEVSSPAKGRPLYSGVPLQKRYAVKLIQWSGDSYDEAVERLLLAYPNNSYFLINTPPGLGPTKQCHIEIMSSSFSMPQYTIDAP